MRTGVFSIFLCSIAAFLWLIAFGLPIGLVLLLSRLGLFERAEPYLQGMDWIIQVPILLFLGILCISIGIVYLLMLPHTITAVVSTIGLRLASDRQEIMSLVNERKAAILSWGEEEILQLLREGKSDNLKREGILYLVDIRARKTRQLGLYRVYVTVQRLFMPPYGRTERFLVKLNNHSDR